MLIGLVLSNCLGLVARYIVKVPVYWVNDVSLLFVLLNTVLGAAVAWSRAEHLTLDLMENIFPKKVKEVLWWSEQIIMVIGGAKLMQLALYNTGLYEGMILSLLGYDESLKCYFIFLAGLLLTVAAIFKIIEKLVDYQLKRKNIPMDDA